MRVSSVLGVVGACVELSGEYPLYVINMIDRAGDGGTRQEYMNATYAHPRYVRATNGYDHVSLITVFDGVDNLQLLDRDADAYTRRLTGATRGQLGNTASLLDAMTQALQDGHEYAIIAEDDVSDTTKCLIPAPLSAYVRYANRVYPDWHSIRLEWGLHRPLFNLIKRAWYHEASKALVRNANGPVLGATWGSWTGEEDFPLLLPSRSGWGTVAVLWSRQGMEHLVTQLKGQTARWRCPEAYRCISDNFFWNLAPENATLITTPPLIGCRTADQSTSEIRSDAAPNSLTHTGITASNVHWLLETYEMLQPRKANTWPATYQYSVGNATFS